MTDKLFAIVSNYSEAEMRAHFLGFCAAHGFEPDEETIVSALEISKKEIAERKAKQA